MHRSQEIALTAEVERLKRELAAQIDVSIDMQQRAEASELCECGHEYWEHYREKTCSGEGCPCTRFAEAAATAPPAPAETPEQNLEQAPNAVAAGGGTDCSSDSIGEVESTLERISGRSSRSVGQAEQLTAEARLKRLAEIWPTLPVFAWKNGRVDYGPIKECERLLGLDGQ